MSTDSYRLFVDDFFIWLDKLKNEGLKRDDIYVTINDIYCEQSDFFDLDSLFEDRFGNVTDEVIAFCPDPFFWDVNLNEYMEKWNKGFTLGFLK